MARRDEHGGGVSPELDDLSCLLMGEALDRLANGEDVNVLLSVGDGRGRACSFEFADDGEEACLKGARDKVRSLVRSHGDQALRLHTPYYYAICYEGSVADEAGRYQDAVLMEFGERGHQAYSAYSLFHGRGEGDQFQWSDPAPAGEVDSLL